jgi:hypothetical protein
MSPHLALLETPDDWPTVLALLLGAGLLLATTAGIWWIVLRLSGIARLCERLEQLEPILRAVEKLRSADGEIELRRVEHALLDIRDGQRKIVDAMLRVAEAGANASGQVPLAGDERGMEERVHNRLLALGYEGVEIARGAWAARGDWPEERRDEDPEADSDAHVEAGSEPGDAVEGDENTYELRVEARRQGVLHKGKVLVRDGRIYDVTMTPSYSIFP